MSKLRIQKLAISIKNQTFKFRPARRIEVEKPGKTTLTPLTIPNFDHRII